MKEEGDDRYNRIDEIIANMEKKFSMIDETSKIKADEFNKVHEDQNRGKAVATRFHGDSIEHEVEQLLRETIAEIGMSTENVKIECPAKPITYAFIYFNDNDERNKYVRSANMLRKELRGRKIKISQSMDVEERFHQKKKRLGYVKYYIHARHGISLPSIPLNRFSKHVSVDGQIVVRTCLSGFLKYHKFQDIESEVEEQLENDWQQIRRNDWKQPWGGPKKQRRSEDYE